jgi:hypothetical protein
MKIAIIDSGVHPGHPHVGKVTGGVGVTAEGFTTDFLDRLGHGTAVAGAIREKAPDADLFAVKVFDRRLSTNVDTLIRAVEWCIEHQMDLINLSLATSNPRFSVFGRPRACPTIVTVPGLLPNAIAVAPDEDCPRDVYRYRDGIFYASPYPRSIPGVPRERNLHGASFAVANMTGFVARVFPMVMTELIARATNSP